MAARAIDTNDDTEMELAKTWDGPVAELNTMLASATETIQQWATRSKNLLRSHGGGGLQATLTLAWMTPVEYAAAAVVKAAERTPDTHPQPG